MNVEAVAFAIDALVALGTDDMTISSVPQQRPLRVFAVVKASVGKEKLSVPARVVDGFAAAAPSLAVVPTDFLL